MGKYLRLKVLCGLLLVMVMLAGCGSESTIDKVDKMLQGEWVDTELNNIWVFKFDNGKVTALYSFGTYEITDNTIKIHYNNGQEAELSYTYDEETLVLEDGKYQKKSDIGKDKGGEKTKQEAIDELENDSYTRLQIKSMHPNVKYDVEIVFTNASVIDEDDTSYRIELQGQIRGYNDTYKTDYRMETFDYSDYVSKNR